MHDRNGTIESIKKIVQNLNDAKLDPNAGMWLQIRISLETATLTTL